MVGWLDLGSGSCISPHTLSWWGKKGSHLRNFFSVQKSQEKRLDFGDWKSSPRVVNFEECGGPGGGFSREGAALHCRASS